MLYADAPVDDQAAGQATDKAQGLQRVAELMRVAANIADGDEQAAVQHFIMPLLQAVQGETKDVVAVHDKALGEVLGEVCVFLCG